MTNRYVWIAVVAVGLSGAACKGKHNRVTVQNEEDTAPRMVSVVHMNDPKASAQLLSGFYSVEANAWRWTAGKFSVLLRTPPGSAQRGATLSVALTVPDAILKPLKKIRLTATIGGKELLSADYSTAGPYVFSAEVPSDQLVADSLRVDFALDKSLPPGADQRELGLIVSSIGLVIK